MSCIYRIKNGYASFTVTEKKIGDYILQNKKNVLLKSSQELAELSDTSAAAWIRFSKKLGYKGLSELKVDLAQEKNKDDELFNVLIEENDSIDVMVKKIQNISIANLDQTYQLINVDQLKTAIKKIAESHRVFLLGVGGSGIVCLDFMHKLLRIDKYVIYYEDPHILLASIAHIKSDDVVLAISYSGETNEVNKAIKKAKEVGATTIAITKYDVKSTLSNLVDLKLYTPIEEKELRLGSIASRNSALILTDLIYYGLAKNDIEKTKEDLIKTRQLINQVEHK